MRIFTPGHFGRTLGAVCCHGGPPIFSCATWGNESTIVVQMTELKPMVRLDRNSPEWHAEWNDLVPLMEQWKFDASNNAVREKITRSLYRIGIVVDQ